jgi:hypothetical protein
MRERVLTRHSRGITIGGSATPTMIERRLKTLIIFYLWVALLEDTFLFLMSWLAPDLWFRVFHGVVPAGLEIAFLRRSAGQWAAFALAQAITLWRWRKEPVWLAVEAGVRFSDLFTDISYVIAVPSLTRLGWAFLLPPPFLNLVGVVIMLRGYKQARRSIAPGT